MKKLRFLLIILLTGLLSYFIAYKLNHDLKVLPNNSNVKRIEEAYLLSDLSFIAEKGTYSYTLITTENKDNPLAIVTNDMGSYLTELSIKQNGVEIYSYGPDAYFEKIHTIPLINEEGDITIELSTSSWQQRSEEIITNRNNSAPKIMIMPLNKANEYSNFYDTICYTLLGIILMIIVSSISLFINRYKESGCLFLIVLSVTRLICLLIDNSIIPLNVLQYSQIHHVIIIVPAILNTTVGVALLHINDTTHHYKTLLGIGLIAIILTLLQYSFHYNWYHLIQLVSLCIMLYEFYKKTKFQSEDKWYILCIGYTVCYTLVFFIYLINLWSIYTPGKLMIYTNSTTYAYTASLISCICYINQYLMNQYNKKEKLSEELSHINANLDEIIKLRTEEVMTLHTKQQSMMLNIFHDLRSPVFILQSYIDKLSVSKTISDNMIATMKSRIEFLNRLIQDLFISEKIECHELELLMDEVELKDLIETLISGIELSSGRSITATGESFIIWADEIRLTQVFENIILNAINYTTEEDTIEINITQDNLNAYIIIKDTGMGMSEESKEHIFERFYTSNSYNKGTGLGMYIAKEIILLHKGTIEVISTLNKGTTFIVTLPKLGENIND